MHDEPIQSESHAGVLKSTEHQAGEIFEFAGQKLLLSGTSGLPKERARIAEGKPIRHDVSSAKRTGGAEAESGPSQVESQAAAGRPVEQGAGPQNAAAGVAGRGELIGGPVRRA